MDAEVSIVAATEEQSAPDAASVLRTLRTRAHRAVEAARRDGPRASRLLRRSIAVYAGEASRHRLPEAQFMDTVHQEVMSTLTSRVSTGQLALLLDAAVQGSMDGYDLRHRAEQLNRIQGHEARFNVVRRDAAEEGDSSRHLGT